MININDESITHKLSSKKPGERPVIATAEILHLFGNKETLRIRWVIKLLKDSENLTAPSVPFFDTFKLNKEMTPNFFSMDAGRCHILCVLTGQ